LIEEINEKDPLGIYPIIGIEPSDIYTLKDEYLDLKLTGVNVVSIANRTYMIDEFLIRPGKDNNREKQPRILRIVDDCREGIEKKHVLIHGHCYQKAQKVSDDGYPVGTEATIKMLRYAGYEAELIDAGCCGMAGAFGYEEEHYELSMRIGELKLFPIIRTSNDDVIICTPGVSCQTQIEDGTGREAMHPIMLL